MTNQDFESEFKLLTGHLPFPWQVSLYERFTRDSEHNIPVVASLPTGLGKTNVIAVWLLALMAKPQRIPRRLVYVVNRRTVVDQTTAEVQRLRESLPKLADKHINRLAVSTLRGQFADNQEWSADPSRPAVICGTVDMIGSRLLFSGYRIGFKSRPLHAGFLGQDALLIHDEAHLEPAFQKLIQTIQDQQGKERDRAGIQPWPSLRVMALSATTRSDCSRSERVNSEPFELTDEEKQPPESIPNPPTEPIHLVWRRLQAKKTLRLHSIAAEKKLAEKVAELALAHSASDAAVLVFLRTVDDVNRARTKLVKTKKGAADRVRQLTGTIRGYERDQLVRDPTFVRFLADSDRPQGVTPTEGTVYLVCTSAGEVGVNLSADQMVCDLTTFDGMAQRLGRVNRFGDCDDTCVDVVHPQEFDDKNPNPQRKATLALLHQLKGDASPASLNNLPVNERNAAFAPEPTILPATDILFDAWALTSIRDKIPGRPPVAPFLHGVADWEPPRTCVAWRKEVELITSDLIEREGPEFLQDLLADYPLKPHELLSDRTSRVLEILQKLADKHSDSPIWLIDNQQHVHVSALGKIANPVATKAQDKRPLEQAIAESIVLLPPSIGGLATGMLDGDGKSADDVADRWFDETGEPRRCREFNDGVQPLEGRDGMALIRTIDLHPMDDESAPHADENKTSDPLDSQSEANAQSESRRYRYWSWFVKPGDAEDATRASSRPVTWDHHTRDVVKRSTQIVQDLKLPDKLGRAVILAAKLHDLGKQREIWQRSIGNPNPTDWHAKSGKPAGKPRWRSRRLTDYRHEFGSLLDVLDPAGEYKIELEELSDELKDLVLHLIAAHHGYARPHFPPDAFDHERYNTQQNECAAQEVMSRYARLQRYYGRWGLAYLESLLRAADWSASAQPSEPTSNGGAS